MQESGLFGGIHGFRGCPIPIVLYGGGMRYLLMILRSLFWTPTGEGSGLLCAHCGGAARLVIGPEGPINANVSPDERVKLLTLARGRYTDVCLECAARAGVDLRKCFRKDA